MTVTCSALSFNRPRFARTFNGLPNYPVSPASRPPEPRAPLSIHISKRTSNLLKTYLSDLQGRLPCSGERQPPLGGERISKIVLLLWEIFLQLFSFLSFNRWRWNIERRHSVIESAFQRCPFGFGFQSRRGQTFVIYLSLDNQQNLQLHFSKQPH